MGLSGLNFAVSALILSLEILHVRLFSYVMDPRLVYAAIAIAFAGLGVGGMLVTVRPAWGRGRIRVRLLGLLALLGLSVVLSSLALAWAAPYFGTDGWKQILLRALPLLLVCSIPYVLAGVIQSICLAAAASAVHRVYGMGLLGSALGCFAMFPLMRPLGVERLLLLLAALAATIGLLFVRKKLRQNALPWWRRGRLYSWALLALCAFGLPFAAELLPFQPDPKDLLGMALRAYQKKFPQATEKEQPRREYAAWDPASRVEVYAFPGPFGKLNGVAPVKLVTQDGGAATIVVDFEGHDDARRAWVERSVYAAGYFLKNKPERVLVVGLGGGVDVSTALFHGAKHVTGVELNESILDVGAHRFGAFQGHLLEDHRVRLVHGDGRSFVEQSQRRGERWSLIQMSGADTFSASAAGAMMFSESYLYTVEAFERYLRALEPDGVLSLIRFGPEGLRVAFSVAEALRRVGIERPEEHVLVLRQGLCVSISVSMKPIQPVQLRAVVSKLRSARFRSLVRLPIWEAMGFGMNESIQVDYIPAGNRSGPYRNALKLSGQERSLLLAKLPIDVSPTSDDRPFFFQFLKPQSFLKLNSLPKDDFLVRALLAYFRFCIGFIVLVAVAMVLPIRRLRQQGTRWQVGAFFGALGLAFMLLEIALIQRTILLLGHPVWSVSVTIASLLVASGLGAMASAQPQLRKAPRITLLVAVAGVVASVVAYHFGWAQLMATLLALPFAVRVAAIFVLVFPLGFCMGFPFVLGLRAFGQKPAVRAWALGANAFLGTLGSLVAVPLAVVVGFSGVMACAVVVYLVAAAMFFALGLGGGAVELEGDTVEVPVAAD